MRKLTCLDSFFLSTMLSVMALSLSCCGQGFVYKPVPVNYVPLINARYLTEVQSYKKTAVDLTKYLPNSFVKDGSVDYTKELQTGLNTNEIMLMPDFPVLTTGINVKSNSTLIFQKNSKLLMVASDKANYFILGLNNVHDVNVYFANIVGDRKQHIGTKGEWGFGISIYASKKLKIIGPTISDCWGDGIYINNLSPKVQNQNAQSNGNTILIDGAQLDNNRRNGLSLIDGHNVTIQNSVMSNSNGTSPMAGIDIEPNNGNGELKNIILDRVVTFNNQSYGILAALGAFQSEISKGIKVSVDSCIDDGSAYGMRFVYGQNKDDDLIYATGNINVIAPIWKNNTKAEVWLPFYGSKNTVKLNIKNPKVYKDGKLVNSFVKPLNLTNTRNISIN